MTRFNYVLAVVLLAGGTISAQSAAAQSVYSPATPAIPAWMGLWQKNTGAVDNYHAFVLPQMQLNQTLQMQNAALNRQELGLQSLNSEVIQQQWNQSTIMPTGQGATYMAYSHYYYGGLRPTSPSHQGQRQGAGKPAARMPAPRVSQ